MPLLALIASLAIVPSALHAQDTRVSSLAKSPALVREGHHLVESPGLLRFLGEDWVFETVSEGKRRSFTLMPSLKLGELEQVASARGEGEYRLSGRVYVYEKRNYLLVSEFASIGESEQLVSQESGTGAPSVADLIREFEQSRADRKQSPADANGRRSEAVAIRREGTILTLGKGRIIQNPAGWAYFEPLPLEGALERDPMATIPVVMLPSLMLEELEALAAFSSDAPIVTLSGEYFAHRGRNYLLPRMYLVERTPTERDNELPPIAGEVAR
jgi:hypothetical protein